MHLSPGTAIRAKSGRLLRQPAPRAARYFFAVRRPRRTARPPAIKVRPATALAGSISGALWIGGGGGPQEGGGGGGGGGAQKAYAPVFIPSTNANVAASLCISAAFPVTPRVKSLRFFRKEILISSEGAGYRLRRVHLTKCGLTSVD